MKEQVIFGSDSMHTSAKVDIALIRESLSVTEARDLGVPPIILAKFESAKT